MHRTPSPSLHGALAAALAVLAAASTTAAAPPAQRLTELFDIPVPGALLVWAPPQRVGGTLFFPGWDARNQWAMWASDGSSDRATLLRNSRAETPVAFDGGAAFYVGSDPTSARLWRSDGSPGGTTAVAELGGPLAGSLSAAGGALYLRGGDGHPWRSDGTETGTLRLSDDAVLTDTPGFTEWNGAVYFLAAGGDAHLGLWSTAGTTTTRRVADLGDGAETSRFAYGLTLYRGRLYFYTSEEAFGARYRLWSYDGSVAGAAALHDFAGTSGPICPGPCFGIGPDTLAGLGGRLLFFADDAVHGRELWRTDGTAGGTQLLADIAPGSEKSVFRFMDPLSYGHTPSYAVFAADDGVHGIEPWVTDGTPAGTRLLVDLAPGPDSSAPYGFVAVGGRIYFSAGDAIRSTDGTAAGTTVFRDGAALLYPIAGGFAAVDANGLWWSDGATLTRLDDLARPRGLEPLGMVPFGGGVAFSRLDADDTLHDLWLHDGTTAGVLQHFASISTLPSAAAGELWLGADDGVHGTEPWISDGTSSGTRLLRDISHAGDSSPQHFTAAASRVFFTAADAAHGVELWETDGTNAGTGMVEDFQPGEFGSVPGYLTSFRGALAFSIFSPPGLWSTDGTESGTRRIAPVPTSFVVAAGETLFFIGYDPSTGYELWKSDGTTAGTALVKDAVPGPNNANSYALTVAGARIFYIGQTGEDQELWTSDGTPAGTVRLAAFRSINELTASGGSVLFAADDRIHGIELWASDGTPQGTRLVRDISPGPTSSSPSSLAEIGDRVFFSADDGVHGIEPWASDGSEPGTQLIEDLTPGPESSNPGQFRLSRGLIYFRASDREAGAQLWSMSAQPAESDRPGERPRQTRTLPPR